VLVPVFLGDHPHHDVSAGLFLKSDKRHDCCSAHSLAEVYATITRLPGRHRISGEQAMLFLQEIRERLTVISLTDREYFEAIEAASSRGVVGGAIYDALIARCALKGTADSLYTWNTGDFIRMGDEVARRVKTPA
jgi:predicted nucleic acid-binding protein